MQWWWLKDEQINVPQKKNEWWIIKYILGGKVTGNTLDWETHIHG